LMTSFNTHYIYIVEISTLPAPSPPPSFHKET
jgi:hypothetical protein